MFILTHLEDYYYQYKEIIPNKLILGYSWNNTPLASYCNLSITRMKDNNTSRIDSYAVCKSDTTKNFVVTNWDGINGITYNPIYNTGTSFDELFNWVENFALTKASINIVFTRLLKYDQYNLFSFKFLTKTDVMCVIYPLETLDNDLI